MTQRLIILGAAGRDFHDFNVVWRHRPDVRVVCFTATQIPGIDDRRYPPALAGPAYPDGIPIEPEDDLEQLVTESGANVVTLAYSDISNDQVMRLAARANAAGASFTLLSPADTMLESAKPVIAVCAVRTGCGKSQVTRSVATMLKDAGHKVAVVRHPMPYGDLVRQAVQRFDTYADLDRHECTIEEREEYEPHLDLGHVVFAGVDYERILREAEDVADVVLWDGGNNDTPFFRPDLLIVLTDPHRAGHELSYYPGATNVRLADVVLVNKIETADPDDIATVEANVRRINPSARLLRTRSPVTLDDPAAVRDKRVLVIEDGPTVTHGGMRLGAGWFGATAAGAREIVDPRPHAVGSIRGVFEAYPHLERVLPAMGYGAAQIAELEATINATPCDVVVVGTPIDLTRLMTLDKPTVRARYKLHDEDTATLREYVLEGLPSALA